MFTNATKEAANDTISDAKATVYNAKRDIREVTKADRSEVGDYAERAGREIRHLIDSAKDEIHQAGDRVKNEIRSNPLRSTGIALGAGVLLGLLIRR